MKADDSCPWIDVVEGRCKGVADRHFLAPVRGDLILKRCCAIHLEEENSLHPVKVMTEDEATVWEVMRA